jgi:hypothetical protein
MSFVISPSQNSLIVGINVPKKYILETTGEKIFKTLISINFLFSSITCIKASLKVNFNLLKLIIIVFINVKVSLTKGIIIL